jgi:hypothetical protein
MYTVAEEQGGQVRGELGDDSERTGDGVIRRFDSRGWRDGRTRDWKGWEDEGLRG